MKLREIAGSYPGSKVKIAVFTVPVYFNDSQRQLLKMLGKVLGRMHYKSFMNKRQLPLLLDGKETKTK